MTHPRAFLWVTLCLAGCHPAVDGWEVRDRTTGETSFALVELRIESGPCPIDPPPQQIYLERRSWPWDIGAPLSEPPVLEPDVHCFRAIAWQGCNVVAADADEVDLRDAIGETIVSELREASYSLLPCPPGMDETPPDGPEPPDTSSSTGEL